MSIVHLGGTRYLNDIKDINVYTSTEKGPQVIGIEIPFSFSSFPKTWVNLVTWRLARGWPPKGSAVGPRLAAEGFGG